MQPDDAADLIAQLSEERGEALLELMEPEEAEDVRVLLAYAPDTAGGLMTTEPIIVSADATVAEGLALIRRHELPPRSAPRSSSPCRPYETPTGRLLGIVHFQRMLRYPPHERLGTLLDHDLEPVRADTSAAEVSRILASYNLVSLPVVDESHRLVGVVTIDDVLDYLLPDDWRCTDGDDEPNASVSTSTRSASRCTAEGGRSWHAHDPHTTPRSTPPRALAHQLRAAASQSRDRFGRFSEAFARGDGHPGFLIGMTVFVVVWLRLEHVRARDAAVRPARDRTSRC